MKHEDEVGREAKAVATEGNTETSARTMQVLPPDCDRARMAFNSLINCMISLYRPWVGFIEIRRGIGIGAETGRATAKGIFGSEATIFLAIVVSGAGIIGRVTIAGM